MKAGIAIALGWFLLSACSPGVKQATTIRVEPNSNMVLATNSALNAELACSIPGIFDKALTLGSSYRSIKHQFRGACVQHDYCYRYGSSTYGLTQAQCDDDLYDQITRLCDDLNANAFRWLCKLRRGTVDLGVTLGGRNSFKRAGYYHEYDAAPRDGRGFKVARSIKVAGEKTQLLVLNVGEASGGVQRFAYQQGRFSSIGLLFPATEVRAQLAAPFAPTVEGEQLVWSHGLRQRLRSDQALAQVTSSAFDQLKHIRGQFPAAPILAPWVRDFDGDGQLDYVALESGFGSHQARHCGQQVQLASDGSRFLSVYSADPKCTSRSILDQVQSGAAVNLHRACARRETRTADLSLNCLNSEKYRKLQFPPLVGNFIVEKRGKAKRLEILLYWLAPRKSDKDLLHAWLLVNESCPVHGGLCWRAQRVAPLSFRNTLGSLPLVRVPSASGPDYIDAFNFQIAEQGACMLNVQPISDRFMRFRIERNKVLKFSPEKLAIQIDRFNFCLDHSALYYHGGKTKGALLTQIVSAQAFDLIAINANKKSQWQLQRTRCALKPAFSISALDIKRSPMIFGAFSDSNAEELALIDLTDPTQSLTFARSQSGNFTPLGLSAQKLSCRAMH